MQRKRERNIQLAYAVLDWNQKHLHKDSELSEDLIGECFADRFIVEPNGRRYEADRRSYKEFLNSMKISMTAIRYHVQHEVSDLESTVFSMQVEISKIGGQIEKFSAMLLMQFDADEKISLWHEVYVQQD